jgi:hypothetical protein
MKREEGRILPIKFEPETTWKPKITRKGTNEANHEKGGLTLYRRSGVWNGIRTLSMVREPLPA